MKHVQHFYLDREPCLVSFFAESADSAWNSYHSHQGLELIYVHQGQGKAIIGSRIYPIKPGMLMIFQPFQQHRVHFDLQSGETYTRSKLLFEPTYFEKQLAHFPALMQFYLLLWKGQLPFQVRDMSCLQPQLDIHLRQHDPSMGDLYAPMEQEAFLIFLVGLLDMMLKVWLTDSSPTAQMNRKLRSKHHAELMMEWIEQHYQEPFQLERLADEVHLSPAHLSHLFKEATGTSISEYIISRRMQEACRLLESTDYPLQDLIQEIGLTNVSYFCQLFKKRHGMTPNHYRIKARSLMSALD